MWIYSSEPINWLTVDSLVLVEEYHAAVEYLQEDPYKTLEAEYTLYRNPNLMIPNINH